MINGYIVISAILAIVFVLLGVTVLYRNPRANSNKLFLLFSVVTALWLVTNYMASTRTVPYDVAYIANRLVFLFAAISTFSLVGFVRTLLDLGFGRAWRAVVIANIVAILGSVTPWIVENISAQGKTYSITFGFLAIPYFVVILTNFLAVVGTLVSSRRKAQGNERAQVDTILVSLATTLVFILVTNALLPFIFNYYALTSAGSFSTMILVGGMAYGIIRHRLFDLRLVIARSLAYVLSLASLGAVFIIGTFLLSGIFFRNTNFNVDTARWVYSLLAMILAFLFAPLKGFFDKITARVFFRDSYDTQVFLDQFNKLLVSTYQVKPLLEKAAVIIQENLKPGYCIFSISATESIPRRVMGTPGHPVFGDSDFELIEDTVPGMRRKFIVADELRSTRNGELQGVLQNDDVAILARLTASGSSTREGIGYLLLGPKKSGNPYGKQDLQVIEIVTNELIIAIQNALRFEEIQNFNETLQEKVVEATNKLRRTNEKLKALDETKDDFISMASHQLRTPLTSVKGYISLVLDGDAGPIKPMQRQLLNQAFSSSQRMVYLISDLLNVSRLRTGKFVIEPSQVNLADVIVDEVDQLKETAAARQVSIDYNKPKDFPDLMLDETKIRQVIMNYMDNAIYYTPTGGHMRVELTNNPATVELRVVDNGIGVPKHEQHHLFTKFYRAGNARKVRPDGTGLGLFMAKKVVTAQGGAVIFESEEGKGSTFGFTFSKTKLAEAARQPVKA